MSTTKLKKSELIIGAFASAFPSVTGVYHISAIDFAKVYNSLVIAPRFTLETNKLIRHLISYCPVVRLTEQNVLQVLVYQRPDNNTGESRLAGNYSIGFGGHVEFKETGEHLFAPKTLEFAVSELLRVLTVTTARENDEEVRPYSDTHGPDFKFSDTIIGSPSITTAIIDNSDDVGQHHVGINTIIRVRDGIEYLAGLNESDAIRIVGWMNLSDLLAEPYWSKMESWSKMLLSTLLTTTYELTVKYREEDEQAALERQVQ